MSEGLNTDTTTTVTEGAVAESVPASVPADGSHQHDASQAPSAGEALSGESLANEPARKGFEVPEPASADEQDKETKEPNEWLGAPEGNYSMDGVDVPEGYDVDPEVLSEVAGIFGDLGLSQKAFAHAVSKVGAAMIAQQERQLTEFKENNIKALKADRELGGVNYEQTMKNARRAYVQYTSEELREVFAQTGLDTHPEVVRLFSAIASATSGDSVVRGGKAQQSSLHSFFNNTKMN